MKQRTGTAALIARGGYLWTRFVAHDEGPHSQAAHDSAARERFLCQAADMVVGTTPDMVEDLSWRYGLDPLHTAVIPNYVLVDEMPRGAAGRTPGLLLYAGQLVARKRVDVLVQALALITPEVREAIRFEIIGDGPERAALERLAASLKVPVVFRSRVPHHDLLARMRECELYIQASELEGHPKTVLEAMASGAAVVVADAPGLGDAVTHGVTGLRVTPDARSFAHAIEELLNDQEWRDMMGSAAAQATRSSLGLDTILPMEVAVHRRALEQARRRAAMGEGEARVA